MGVDCRAGSADTSRTLLLGVSKILGLMMFPKYCCKSGNEMAALLSISARRSVSLRATNSPDRFKPSAFIYLFRLARTQLRWQSKAGLNYCVMGLNLLV